MPDYLVPIYFFFCIIDQFLDKILNTILVSVTVCLGCYYSILQAGWLLNNRLLFLTFPESRSLRSRSRQIRCQWEAASWFIAGVFSLCPHMESWVRALASYKGTNPIMKPLRSWPQHPEGLVEHIDWGGRRCGVDSMQSIADSIPILLFNPPVWEMMLLTTLFFFLEHTLFLEFMHATLTSVVFSLLILCGHADYLSNVSATDFCSFPILSSRLVVSP